MAFVENAERQFVQKAAKSRKERMQRNDWATNQLEPQIASGSNPRLGKAEFT